MKFRIREEYCPSYKQILFYPECYKGGIFGFFGIWVSLFRIEEFGPCAFGMKAVDWCRTLEQAEQVIEEYKAEKAKDLENQYKIEVSKKTHYL